MKKQDIITRRKFFKQSASVILPTLAAIAIPSALTSCEIEENYPIDVPSTGCDTCKGNCGGQCQTGCTGSCKNGCTGNCKGACGSSCYALCTGKNKYG